MFSFRLGIENDEQALDEAIERLTSNADLISLWQTSASACRSAVPESLTEDQQPVFLLACISARLRLDCALQDESSAPCVGAGVLLGKHPCSLTSLVPREDRRQCLREVQEANGEPLPRKWGQFRRRESVPCPQLLAAAESAAVCALRAAELADEDTVDRDALQTAASEQEESEALLAILGECPQTDLNELISCWITVAPEICLLRKALQLAEIPLVGIILPK